MSKTTNTYRVRILGNDGKEVQKFDITASDINWAAILARGRINKTKYKNNRAYVARVFNKGKLNFKLIK